MASSGSVRPPDSRLAEPAESCCTAAADDGAATISRATPFSAMYPLASAMKIGHCCADPLPVVTMVMVSAAAAGRGPSPAAAIAATMPSNPNAIVFMASPLASRGVPAIIRQAVKPRRRPDRRQQRHHRADKCLKSRQHRVEVEQKQLDADLLIAAHAFGDDVGCADQGGAQPARRG